MAQINKIPRDGILSDRLLRQAVGADWIYTERFKIPDTNFQPASLDLRLGETAHRLRCSFLPDASVEDKLPGLEMGTLDLRDGAILEKNRPYLIPLLEELNLPKGIRAKANPKSSTGRLDIFTRVITDRSHRFDDIAEGYSGRLYLEVVSRSFTIKVRSELSLNQLRLFKGDSACESGELLGKHRMDPILFHHADHAGEPREPRMDNTVSLGVDLVGHNGVIGYRAKKNSSLLDLSQEHYYDHGEYWEPVHTDATRSLILEPEEFYLLTSAEGINIPPQYAAELTAIDPSSGELRTHYAGFFDPGFGLVGTGATRGVQPVMEVRAHDVPFMIEHGQTICTLTFERMLETPKKMYGTSRGSSYQGRGLILSKHFRPLVDQGELPVAVTQPPAQTPPPAEAATGQMDLFGKLPQEDAAPEPLPATTDPA
jgi:dCTP deaminase